MCVYYAFCNSYPKWQLSRVKHVKMAITTVLPACMMTGERTMQDTFYQPKVTHGRIYPMPRDLEYGRVLQEDLALFGCNPQYYRVGSCDDCRFGQLRRNAHVQFEWFGDLFRVLACPAHLTTTIGTPKFRRKTAYPGQARFVVCLDVDEFQRA